MPVALDPNALQAARDRLARARRVVVSTGAGISADSGIPTFRDALTGLWARYDPTELATPDAFRRNPRLVTRWYDQRRRDVLGCQPNPGHDAIATLERQVLDRGGDFVLLTQNVDGLHQRAGSQHVYEVHGSLLTWRDTVTGRAITCDHAEAFGNYPPVSPDGNPLRPGVVWFGEMLPGGVMDLADHALRRTDVFLCVGTSGSVYPAAGFVHAARSTGATCIEVNPDATDISEHFDLHIRARAAEALPRLVDVSGSL